MIEITEPKGRALTVEKSTGPGILDMQRIPNSFYKMLWCTMQVATNTIQRCNPGMGDESRVERKPMTEPEILRWDWGMPVQMSIVTQMIRKTTKMRLRAGNEGRMRSEVELETMLVRFGERTRIEVNTQNTHHV